MKKFIFRYRCTYSDDLKVDIEAHSLNEVMIRFVTYYK